MYRWATALVLAGIIGGASAIAATSDPSPAASGVELAVPLPEGETRLADIGVYQVSWQSYSEETVEMPLSWSGHFEPRSGISYQDWGRVLDRPALLMHSPWHVPPGKVWADYRLQLPNASPIRLSFGIAMGPDVASPDKSDGVTFSCFLFAGGRSQELLRRHHDKAEWRDYSFDLTPHAGKTIGLRLQVEPGPKNNSSFDYSFFGDAKIQAGKAEPSLQGLLDRLTGTKAYRATAETSRTSLANQSDRGVVPSNLLEGKNELAGSSNAWQFTYQGADARIAYSYRPASGTLDDWMVQIDGGAAFQPARGGTISAEVKQDGKASTVGLRGGKAQSIQRKGDSLEVVWAYPLRERQLAVVWTFRIVGKALVVSVRCEEPVVSRFSLGDVGLAPLRKTFLVPYLLGRVAYLPVQNAFVCRYLDWTQSHASRCPQGDAEYDPKTDGSRNALAETGYVAVSPDLGEVLPNLPNPPSPYLAQLGPRIMLDIWGHHKGTYQGDAENVLALKDLGVDHVAIIQHVWQRYGYDVKLPDHLPANPAFGGDQGMVAFGQAANRCGYLWSLHENYIDLYPDAPSYDPAARVLQSDGSPSKAWYNEGTKVQSFGLKCNRALGFAEKTAPEAHRRFATTAAYLDVHSCVPPWHQLDHESGQPMAAMASAKVKYDTELFQFMRASHQGPLFGEGANHFYWAGRCDGVEAQVHGGEDHQPLLDFDLLKIHPQMVNHGMGYYQRWFRGGYKLRWGHDVGNMEQVDKYRAQELAYGHAGFVGSENIDNLQWVLREHHLMHPVQRLYGASKPVQIQYEVGGRMVTASVALVAGDTSRQRIRYQSGLTLWINWRPEPWQVEGRALPQWGFLALGPQTEVTNALRDGKWSDYAECPEFLFADARTTFDTPYRSQPRDIEPRLERFEHLGGNRVRVTYKWVVNETLEDDYHCFVHGVRRDSENPEGIAFQQDHRLPKPTSQWRKGEVIVDGPYEISLPDGADRYDLTIGLFNGERLLLKGTDDGNRRIVIGRLKLDRQGGQIVKAEADTAPPTQGRSGGIDMGARLNPPGTMIEFGKLATDGSVKVNRGTALDLYPYPPARPVRVSLDLKQIGLNAEATSARVRALEARTGRDLGPVSVQIQEGRLVLTMDKAGAGRYRVEAK